MLRDSFRIDTEQRAAIRFFVLKGLKVRAIHTEFESVYGPEVLTLPAMKKWRRCFHQRRMDLFDGPGPESA
jgi:hypothetical protein